MNQALIFLLTFFIKEKSKASPARTNDKTVNYAIHNGKIFETTVNLIIPLILSPEQLMDNLLITVP